jgi:N-acetylmuramoyl-L-alanine amidase
MLFFWHTSHRLPWLLAGGSLVVVSLFTALMLDMVRNDTKQRELTCLAKNVYYEARGEPLEGQHGVAEVTMNRVVDSRYPATVCEVVYQQRWDYLRKRHVSAFSWTEFDSVEQPQGSAWTTAIAVADSAFHGRRSQTLEGAVHYHATHIRPSWARGKEPVARIGRHIFYR